MHALHIFNMRMKIGGTTSLITVCVCVTSCRRRHHNQKPKCRLRWCSRSNIVVKKNVNLTKVDVYQHILTSCLRYKLMIIYVLRKYKLCDNSLYIDRVVDCDMFFHFTLILFSYVNEHRNKTMSKEQFSVRQWRLYQQRLCLWRWSGLFR